VRELPAGWVETTLGDITVDRAQRVPATNEQFQYVDIASIDRLTKRITSPQLLWGRDAPSRARKEIRAGDVLVSMTRPNLNAVALVPPEFDLQIASTGFDVLRSIGIEPRWLFYVVRSQSFIDRMSELVQGALYPAVRSKDVRGYVAPLAPLNEQKRIADKLDAILVRVDACRERLDRVPAILKRFRQAVLAAATSGQLTEEWREMHDPNSKAIYSWKEVALSDLCESSFYGPRFGKDEYTQSNPGVPTIRTTDMTRDGRIEITKDTPKVIVPQDKVEHFRVQKGDLLVTRTGSIGVMAVFEDDYLAIPSAYLIRFRFSPQVLSRYVFYCLMAPAGQERLGLSTTAITQPNVNAEAIKRIKVQFPSIDEQHEIVRRVEALFAYANRLEACYAATRAKVEHLTPALLAKAFRGELVPQDPNDEPASILLERIRTAREASEGTSAPKRRKGGNRPKASQKAEVLMLTRRDIQDTHLTTILKERGPLTAEALWSASQLDIDDFYDQLKDEEERGLLREKRGDASSAPRMLEAA
jgi:type I restriction enzyme S subunit